MTVTSEPTVSAGEALRQVSRLFGALQQRNFACCDLQSFTHCHILTTLHREGEQTLSALTRALNVDKAWLSRSTDELVTQGLLVKAPHPTDRRALRLHLTDAGVRAAAELNTRLNAQAERVLARLPASQREQALRVLVGLAGALEHELAEPEATPCTAGSVP